MKTIKWKTTGGFEKFIKDLETCNYVRYDSSSYEGGTVVIAGINQPLKTIEVTKMYVGDDHITISTTDGVSLEKKFWIESDGLRADTVRRYLIMIIAARYGFRI